MERVVHFEQIPIGSSDFFWKTSIPWSDRFTTSAAGTSLNDTCGSTALSWKWTCVNYVVNRSDQEIDVFEKESLDPICICSKWAARSIRFSWESSSVYDTNIQYVVQKYLKEMNRKALKKDLFVVSSVAYSDSRSESSNWWRIVAIHPRKQWNSMGKRRFFCFWVNFVGKSYSREIRTKQIDRETSSLSNHIRHEAREFNFSDQMFFSLYFGQGKGCLDQRGRRWRRNLPKRDYERDFSIRIPNMK